MYIMLLCKRKELAKVKLGILRTHKNTKICHIKINI